MTKREAGSQIGNLFPDHGKSGINLNPLRAGVVPHAVENLLMRATTSGAEYTIWGKVVASPESRPW